MIVSNSAGRHDDIYRVDDRKMSIVPFVFYCFEPNFINDYIKNIIK